MQQSDGSCNVTSNSQFLYKLIKNSLFIFVNTYENYKVSRDYCIASHDDKMCFLPKCGHHIIITEVNKELLQLLNAIWFNYHHVDSPSRLFEYRGTGKIVVKSGQLIGSMQRAN